MATNARPGAFDPALLKELEAALAQHLGPIARVAVHDAAKTAGTLAELVRLLAWEIPDAAKPAFQKKFSDVSWVRSQPASGPATKRVAADFSREILAEAEQRLAQYLGPVARVVVKRAAVNARDEAELYLLLAEEIEDPKDRKAFSRAGPSAPRGH
jgi:eukaryotic-like serine/threonine-protein kinase